MSFPETAISKLVQKVDSTDPRRLGEEHFRYIDISSVDKKLKAVTSMPQVACHEAPSRARQLVRAGDILVSTVRPNLNGVAMLESEHCGAIASTGYSVLRPRADKAYGRYLFHWVRTGRFVDTMLSVATGANYPAVSDAKVKASTLPLPSLDEQKRIARILDDADALRAKRRESIAQLNALVRSTFLEMFGDPFSNPKNFPIRLLKDFYINPNEGTRCGPFGSALKKSEITANGVPVWNMENIGELGRPQLPFRMWISGNKYDKLKGYSVNEGDIIISRAGTVGRMCVASGCSARGIINTNLIRLRLGADLLPIYFVSLMTYCKGRVGRLKTGPDGSFTHMNVGILDNLRLPYPTLEAQRRFESAVVLIESQRSQLMQHQRELDTLFTSLQSRAFAGKL